MRDVLRVCMDCSDGRAGAARLRVPRDRENAGQTRELVTAQCVVDQLIDDDPCILSAIADTFECAHADGGGLSRCEPHRVGRVLIE